MSQKLLNIAIPGTAAKYFTYQLPEQLYDRLQPGQRCIVPLGKRNIIGYFLEYSRQKPPRGLRKIDDILDRQSLFNKELYSFLLWLSSYYLANPGDVFNSALPPQLRHIKKPSYKTGENYKKAADSGQLPDKVAEQIKSKGCLSAQQIKTIEKEYPNLLEELIKNDVIKPVWINSANLNDTICIGYRLEQIPENDPFSQKLASLQSNKSLLQKKEITDSGLTSYSFKKLLENGSIVPVFGLPDLFSYIKPRPEIDKIWPNKEQKEAIEEICKNLDSFKTTLLYGITGSGKTLVYCHIAREMLRKKRSTLLLVPEIALAGTLLSYFKSYFGEDVALIHSGLRPKERLLIWQNIKNGRYKIIIGARSALFAPLENIGLIIVDEEHDESYKQDDPSPRFQGRDAAVMRAKMADIPIVLGSATPSLESFYNSYSKRYDLVKLTHRPEKAEIPLVQMVDLKREHTGADNLFFTATMKQRINKSLDNNEQVILYLNRRGFSPRIKCTDCGATPECPHCQISLTYHKSGHRLMCHFCGYIAANYNSCISCGGEKFLYLGSGTQKIEEKIGELFENARMIRLDSDSARGREKTYQVLSDFAAGKYNLLLGTQMVTKGIDFPDVSLVGVLMADIGMDMPDFRASEKLFAKLIQVAGRSGRGIIPGEVVIQSFNPEKDLIDDAARQDFDTFYGREIKSRQNLFYPPFSHLINIRFSAKKEEGLAQAVLHFKSALEQKIKWAGLKADLLGPAPCPLYRLRGMYRRHLFLKTDQIQKMIRLLDNWRDSDPNLTLPSRIRHIIDVDPYDMM